MIRAAAPELLHPDTDRWRRAAVNMLVAEATVDAFHATPDVDIAFHDGPATMRFAQEWMVANAHRHITSTDVAQAAGINARALQAAFQRHADTTPMAFLRQIRLHRVRAQLVAGETPTTVIADVARGWGFGHLGRFASYYADTFENDHPTRSADRHRDSAATQTWVPTAGPSAGAADPRLLATTVPVSDDWSGDVLAEGPLCERRCGLLLSRSRVVVVRIVAARLAVRARGRCPWHGDA